MRGLQSRSGGRLLVAVQMSLLAFMTQPASSDAEESAGRGWPGVFIPEAYAGDAVRSALDGAARRLAEPRCQEVLSDFRDLRGHPLREKLAESGKTGSGYLRLILFRDGSHLAPCSADALAVTAPGSRVVFVCIRRFQQVWLRQRRRAEAILIHEALHTLGLGENPPSSNEITFHVLGRCDR